jgi:hypothetical protein
MRTLSPDSPRSASPSPSTHKRRKSSCSTDAIDRRPKKGDEDYIKRPENAFILFRRKCCEDRQQAQEEAATAADGPAKKQRQADLSKTISQQWKSLTAEERQYWEGLAKEKKKEHEQMYPNYVYRPQRAKDKDGRTKNKKAKGRHEESESLSFVLPMPARHHGRSASAPTPPPYQSIQIPNIYHMTPSCPTSPSLLPMISRRSAHPGHEEAVSDFDYMPTNSYLPQSFGQVGQFEASLQSSEFLRSMFSISGQPVQRSDPPQLQALTLSSHDSVLLPSHIISPVSSRGSTSSSGPSSPNPGPFTPTSAFLPQPFCGSEPSQAELDLQLEMQMQSEYAAYSWETNGSLWSTGADMLLGDDFDLSAIPPIEIGVPKYQEDLGPPCGIEFGHAFTQALEGSQYPDEGQNLDSLLGFDEMMAGHGF